ncbi:MAG TPA: hypothetical protein VE377_23415 [Candidatus Dormibacteraeota bacterium]|nr:hypothetical protein [Candidatus Dormibacteraeota bacterium]
MGISIGAAPASIGTGANYQFTATVTGTTNQTVAWTASAGTIDSSTGLFIAPTTVPSPASVTITATAAADASAKKNTTITVQATDPLGTVSSSSQLGSCAGSVSGGTCYQLALSCPGVADFSAYLKVNNPAGAPVGTVLLGVGTGGSGLYDDPTAGGYDHGSDVVMSLVNNDYNTVQVSFGAPFDNGTTPRGWLTGPGGVRRLACRYATVADWVYNHPKIINPGVPVTVTNSAPMCATGNSGGSAAVAYAAFEYGLDSELAMIEPTSGPVMSRIDQGCSSTCSAIGNICPGSNNVPNMCYLAADAKIIDEAYQSNGASTPTPCTDALNGTSGANTAAQLLSDSILYGGSSQNIHMPNTVLMQLLGDDDTSNAVPQATTWEGQVTPSPSSPVPHFACLAGVQHDIPSFATGATQIANDIVANCH